MGYLTLSKWFLKFRERSSQRRINLLSAEYQKAVLSLSQKQVIDTESEYAASYFSFARSLCIIFIGCIRH